MGGLNVLTTEEMLLERLNSIAPVSKVNILRNRKDFASRGIAIFDLADPKDSTCFFNPSMECYLDGRLLYFQMCTMDEKSKKYVRDRRVQIKNLPTESQINNLWEYFKEFG